MVKPLVDAVMEPAVRQVCEGMGEIPCRCVNRSAGLVR